MDDQTKEETLGDLRVPMNGLMHLQTERGYGRSPSRSPQVRMRCAGCRVSAPLPERGYGRSPSRSPRVRMCSRRLSRVGAAAGARLWAKP
jgi:hypothetical protein